MTVEPRHHFFRSTKAELETLYNSAAIASGIVLTAGSVGMVAKAALEAISGTTFFNIPVGIGVGLGTVLATRFIKRQVTAIDCWAIDVGSFSGLALNYKLLSLSYPAILTIASGGVVAAIVAGKFATRDVQPIFSNS